MDPVTVRISRRPISVGKVIDSVRTKSAGGLVVFIGTVRDKSDGRRVSKMELEAADDMARNDLARICKEASKKDDVSKMAVVHRVGMLDVGDVIIVIAVSAPHRKEAFSACRHVIDELKKTTPIWKKELDGKSSRWVDGEVN
ncbi:MAG TPA: molybdenum cofactor biosynthesis protein MoaE [Thermoplasmata archaeon]